MPITGTIFSVNLAIDLMPPTITANSASAITSPVIQPWPDSKLSAPLPELPADFGSVEAVGRVLFNHYGLPFELVSLLIVVAMFGAMVLAKKRLWA